MSTITTGETRQWEGTIFTFVWRTLTPTSWFHCAGCDTQFDGTHCNIWRNGSEHTFWCDDCHEIVVNSGQEVARG